MNSLIKNQDLVLFQGDSITDLCRSNEYAHELGLGYVLMIAALHAAQYPEKQVTFMNRGISGNRVTDLQERWQQDCLDLKPTWVSIFIGINNTWRRYDSNNPTSTEEYEAGYRDLLVRTKAELGANIILMEPFVLPVLDGQKAWRDDLDPKINVVRELAREFNTLLVPLDGIFAQASTRAASSYWAPDGVHPSPAGHALIAKAWLKTVGVEL
ncbi:GDSL family lipase [Paenibacillus psychroresistens]|uniref:GDSL family lipase n=1 Tax=Paenibacillus psychroresistens TaxID=1778678 RepID=A0A6B8RPN0_9BACL|nr:SGNH/GDSL hydrolase family protein [Paenibacillus psychroresistens]QGQ98310.1 GDSL family lipase [Paenibacillus psychroresistens]